MAQGWAAAPPLCRSPNSDPAVQKTNYPAPRTSFGAVLDPAFEHSALQTVNMPRLLEGISKQLTEGKTKRQLLDPIRVLMPRAQGTSLRPVHAQTLRSCLKSHAPLAIALHSASGYAAEKALTASPGLGSRPYTLQATRLEHSDGRLCKGPLNHEVSSMKTALARTPQLRQPGFVM